MKIADKRAANKDAHEARDRKSKSRAAEGRPAMTRSSRSVPTSTVVMVRAARCGAWLSILWLKRSPISWSKRSTGRGWAGSFPSTSSVPPENEVSLNCDLAAFEDLEVAEEIQFVPGSVGYATYGPQETLTLPYYGLGLAAVTAAKNAAQAVTHDALPLGEVGVHRGDCVHATDGEIGMVKGLVIERRTHHVTHVLLQEGHLWGRREVAIPIGAVTTFEGGIQLNMPKAAVKSLPLVVIEHSAL